MSLVTKAAKHRHFENGCPKRLGVKVSKATNPWLWWTGPSRHWCNQFAPWGSMGFIEGYDDHCHLYCNQLKNPSPDTRRSMVGWLFHRDFPTKKYDDHLRWTPFLWTAEFKNIFSQKRWKGDTYRWWDHGSQFTWMLHNVTQCCIELGSLPHHVAILGAPTVQVLQHSPRCAPPGEPWGTVWNRGEARRNDGD